ncbi:MAG: galactokinase [Pyrinomonadaceae bacterium]
MFKIVEGNPHGLEDVDWFVQLLNRPPGPLGNFFDTSREIIVTRAPGRLDVMGGIADYSGSLVLEMPIAEATFAAIQKNSSRVIEIAAIGEETSTFEMDLADLVRDEEPLDLASAKNFFAERNADRWVNYAAGAFFVLCRELGIRFRSGAKVLVASRVPIGKGVSSSAALEVSVMQAVCSAYEIDIAARDLALLCQIVENHIVGAACGVMDQITAHCGKAGKLTALVCQPAEIRGWIDIPEEIEFWGIDSGVRHAVSSSDYSSVRVGAFMGYRIIAELAGLRVREVGEGLMEIDDPRWHGYLSNVTPKEYESKFQDVLPVAMSGQEFLSLYRGTTDTATSIDLNRMYAIKAPTEHPIYENWRVHRFADLMTADVQDDQLCEAGELMFSSHASYKACGLTEPRTDRIVDLVRAGRDNGLFGARITGGGSGGTVAVLARRGCREAIDELAARMVSETGQKPYIFHGSSPGCSLFGRLRLAS